ncbi:MAG: EFR1 family ferrodoxin [Anaerotignum sp.]|nr:EFR1 family ferrodoxin [Anaerotignum sp.]
MAVTKKKVWAVYFSPTGGTKTVVQTTAEELAAKLNLPLAAYDFTPPAVREQEAVFGEGDIVVFGTPVIAGRVPNVLLPYLRERVKGNGAWAVPMVSFGNRNYDDALIELRNILEEDGFRTVAGGAFISEHSFSCTLGAGRPDERDKAILKEFAGKIAEKLNSDWVYTAPAYVKGEEPVRPYFIPQDRYGAAIDIRKVKPQTKDTCCDCGICIKACPMGSISRDNPREYTGICIKCGACVKKCPVGAKYYDDPGYIYHKEELEELYERRAEPEYFV